MLGNGLGTNTILDNNTHKRYFLLKWFIKISGLRSDGIFEFNQISKDKDFLLSFSQGPKTWKRKKGRITYTALARGFII